VVRASWKVYSKSFKFVVCNPCQSPPSLTILVALRFIMFFLVVLCLTKLLFSGFLQFKGNFVLGKNNSIYRVTGLLKTRNHERDGGRISDFNYQSFWRFYFPFYLSLKFDRENISQKRKTVFDHIRKHHKALQKCSSTPGIVNTLQFSVSGNVLKHGLSCLTHHKPAGEDIFVVSLHQSARHVE